MVKQTKTALKVGGRVRVNLSKIVSPMDDLMVALGEHPFREDLHVGGNVADGDVGTIIRFDSTSRKSGGSMYEVVNPNWNPGSPNNKPHGIWFFSEWDALTPTDDPETPLDPSRNFIAEADSDAPHDDSPLRVGDKVRVIDDACKSCPRYGECRVNKGDEGVVVAPSGNDFVIVESPSFGKMGTRPDHQVSIGVKHLEKI
jgi:hypothetical protein